MEVHEKDIQYAEVVKHLALVLDRYRLYPEKHPAAQLAVRNAMTVLDSLLQAETNLTLGFVEGRMVVNDQFMDSKKAGVGEVLRECQRLQIESLTFERGVGEAGLSSLFKLMAAAPKTLESVGGFRSAFEQASFEHIRLGTTLFKLVREEEEVVRKGEVGPGEKGTGEEAPAERAPRIERMEDVIEHCSKGSEGDIEIDVERLSFELEKKPDAVAQQMLVRAEGLEGLKRIVSGMAGFLERRLAQPFIREGKDFSAPVARLAREFRKAVLNPAVPAEFRASAEGLAQSLEQAADAIKLELVVKAFQESGGDGKALARIGARFLRGKEAREKLGDRLRVRLVNLGVPEDEINQALAKLEERNDPKRSRRLEISPEELEELRRLRDRLGQEPALPAEKEAVQFDQEKKRVLDEINAAMRASSEPRAAAAALLSKIAPFSPPGAASAVRVIHRETKAFEALACRNLNGGKPNGWQSAHSLARAVVETGTPLAIPNLQGDPRAEDQEFVRKYRLMSYLGVPLLAKMDVGVLEFFTKEEHEFSDEEIRLLATVAEQAATALHDSQIQEGMTKLADELAKSNRVKEEFLSVISHELRTPLSAIMGYAGMIRERTLGELNPRQEEALEKLMTQSSELLRTINTILEATSIEAGGVEVDCREFSFKSLLEELKSLYDAPLGKELTLVWDTPGELLTMKTDRVKLKHILQNLINNAIEFTDKGQVTISARCFPQTKKVEFKVADTGKGMPSECLPMVFDLFRQVDSSGARPHGGLGLGLYIAKKYSEMLGGDVDVETEPGKGSTFTVTVPFETVVQPSPRLDPFRQFIP